MSGNTYGKLFTVTSAGESHGPALGAIVGAVVAGGKGAAIGAVIGAGGGAGTVMIEGRDRLDLPRGTEVTITAARDPRYRE